MKRQPAAQGKANCGGEPSIHWRCLQQMSIYLYLYLSFGERYTNSKHSALSRVALSHLKEVVYPGLGMKWCAVRWVGITGSDVFSKHLLRTCKSGLLLSRRRMRMKTRCDSMNTLHSKNRVELSWFSVNKPNRAPPRSPHYLLILNKHSTSYQALAHSEWYSVCGTNWQP